jgi:prepilin-type N-terminal cleavage/methylation domain-containing protein
MVFYDIIIFVYREINMLKKYSAFTLIELLFVIAIIGVMASLGISYMTKRAEDAKIQKAALQIQQILEAGLNYYADQKQWPPATPNATSTCPPGTEEGFCPYIPALEAMLENPWGVPTNGTKGYKWQYTEDIKKGNFQVITTAPKANVARRVAAILPNATVPENTTTVTATVANPRGTIGAETSDTLIRGYGSSDKVITLDESAHGGKNCKQIIEGTRICREFKFYPVSGRDYDSEHPLPKDFFQCPMGMDGDIWVFHKSVDLKGKRTVLNIKKSGHACKKGEKNTFACPIWLYLAVGDKTNVIKVTYNYILICRTPK